MLYIIAIIFLLIYAAVVRSIYERSVIDVTKINILHELASEKEPVFLYFADLHSVSFGKDNKKILDRINAINPDAIIIGGDMVIKKKKYFFGDNKYKDVSINLLNELTAKYPVYYGFGNHESHLKTNEQTRVEFKNYIYRIENENMHILTNSHQYVTYKGTRFCIYGLETCLNYYSKKKVITPDASYITKCLGESPDHNHSIPIVISHNPDAFDAVAEWGAEYVLSGHNHGGFVRLPVLGGVIASNYRLFPKYSAGIYKHKTYSSTMLLTRGLGSHTINFRLFNKPELMVIRFKKKGSSDEL
ncbi:MAG: metallophosphoesterase [Lachnospiraceae bacterium]|nr:metallophosphoesterase [Lachnospiraceae bacterium]